MTLTPSAWTEPTRRLPFSARFSYDGRYGASLVAFLLGGYLLLNVNISQLALGLSGFGGFPLEQTLYFGSQYLFAIAVVVIAALIAPAATGRRIIAVVLMLVLLVIWTVVAAARISGSAGPLPFATGFVTAPSFIVPLALPAAWLVLRERPIVTYVLLLLSFIGGAVPFFATINGVSFSTISLVLPAVVLGLGAGIAWAARAIAAGASQLSASRGYVDGPPPPAV